MNNDNEISCCNVLKESLSKKSELERLQATLMLGLAEARKGQVAGYSFESLMRELDARQ